MTSYSSTATTQMCRPGWAWRCGVFLALCLSSSQLVSAQSSEARVTPACRIRSSADTSKAFLVDTTAPRRWGSETVAAIAQHKACVGMTRDMLVQSWGMPSGINVTSSRNTKAMTAQYSYHAGTVIIVGDTVRAIRSAAGGGR